MRRAGHIPDVSSARSRAASEPRRRWSWSSRPTGPDRRTARVAPGGTVRWENSSRRPQCGSRASAGRDFRSLRCRRRPRGRASLQPPWAATATRCPAPSRRAIVIVGAEVRRPRPRGRGCDRREVVPLRRDRERGEVIHEEWVPRFELTRALSRSPTRTRSSTRAWPRSSSTSAARARSRSGRAADGAGNSRNYKWSGQRQERGPETRGSTASPCDFARPRRTRAEPRSRIKDRRRSSRAGPRVVPVRWRAV